MLQAAAPVHLHDEREPGRSVGGGAELQLEPRGNQVRWQGLLPQGHQVKKKARRCLLIPISFFI